MPKTPNHDYNVPNEGATGWHLPLNANFEQFDTDVEIRDTDANRTNYDANQGAKFFATDTGRIYLGTGSSWNQVATSGPSPNLEFVETTGLGIGTTPSSSNGLTALMESGQGSTIEAETTSGENTAAAVHAEASSSSGNTFGTYSTSRSPDGHGVFGVNFAGSGSSIGVEGRVTSADGVGVKAVNSGGTALLSSGDCEVRGDLDVTLQATASTLGVGTESPSTALDVEGDSGSEAGRVENTNTADSTTYGLTGVSNSPGPYSFGVKGQSMASSGVTFGVGGFSDSPDGGGVYGYTDSSNGYGVYGRANGAGYGLYSDGPAKVAGDLDVSGTKNFTQAVETPDGEKEVVYTATEAGTPHTEASGVAELEAGRAEIDLPEHFGWVTSDEEPLHVQTTPYSVDSGGLAVVERSTERLVVEDCDGEGDYEFAYTVKGTREGHADKQVVREPTVERSESRSPTPADD